MWREAEIFSEQKSHHKTFHLCLWDNYSCSSLTRSHAVTQRYLWIWVSVFGCYYLSSSDIASENSVCCYQALFNLIQLLLEVLTGALHHFYFMKDTLQRNQEDIPLYHVYLSTPMLIAFKADILNGIYPPLMVTRRSL